MTKRFGFTLAILIIVFGGVFGWYGMRQHFIKKYFSTFAFPPSIVSTEIAKSQTWQPFLVAVGSLNAVNGVNVSPELAGQVKSIYFKDGESVKTGQPLVQLDDSSERAQLKSMKAQLHLTQLTLERVKSLVAQKASTQAALDDAHSNVKQLTGNVENINATIAKKLLRAPFDGKLGIKQINVGQYLAAGQVCVNLQAVNALNVQFSLPQQDIQKVTNKQIVEVSSDSYPGEFFKGFISAIDSKVDDNTRTIQVQGVVDNSSHKLYPGMFVSLRMYLPTIPNSVVVPQTAITYTLYGDSAFIVTLTGQKNDKGYEEGTVKRVFVRTGDKQDNYAQILEGIKAGDIIVNSGQSKLDDGSKVAINNSIKL